MYAMPPIHGVSPPPDRQGFDGKFVQLPTRAV